MSEPSPAPAPSAPPDGMETASDLKSLVVVCYVLFLLASLNGVTALAGVIVAYMKRADAGGTIWKSHIDNLIFVFWVTVAGAFLGVLSWPIAFGAFFIHWPLFWWPSLTLPFAFAILIFPLLAIWYLYRTIRGIMRASENKPY
jgi:uncharacterized membrane protein